MVSIEIKVHQQVHQGTVIQILAQQNHIFVKPKWERVEQITFFAS
jgi:hypothetical protein